MVEEKGLDGSIADKIGEYVKLKGSTELLEKLISDSFLTKNKRAKEGLEDVKLLLTYLKAFGILHRVSFFLLPCSLEMFQLHCTNRFPST